MADPAKSKAATSRDAAIALRRMAREAAEVSESAAALEASAGAVERSSDIQTETAIRRTILASDRTVLAVERTYAAWIRTGLASLASGVGAHAVFGDELPYWLVAFVGGVLVVFAGFAFAVAAWRQIGLALKDPKPEIPKLPTAVSVGFSALLVLTCMAALAEILLVPRG